MGFRYHKSVKILPGMRINFSKSGTSMSIGSRGFTTNYGHGKRTTTIGIPGTGLSYRTTKTIKRKVSSANGITSKNNNTIPSKQSNGIYTSKNPPASIKINMDQDGKITIYSPEGCEILDTGLLRKIKSMPMYKEEKDKLERKRRDILARELSDAQLANRNMINIHKYAPSILTYEEKQKEYETLTPERYNCRVFEKKKPDKDALQRKLAMEAIANVNTKAFWKINKLREEYVEKNLSVRFAEMMADYEKEKSRFETYEEKVATERNQQYQTEYEAKKKQLEQVLQGEADIVESNIDNWISSCTLPIDVNLDYSYDEELGDIVATTELPDESYIPNIEIVKNKSGSLHEKQKSQQTLRQEYAILVLGYAMYLAANLFNASVTTQRILLSGFANRRNKEGALIQECIYSIVFTRERFEKTNIHFENPEEYILNFENRCIMTTTKTFKKVIPFTPEEALPYEVIDLDDSEENEYGSEL